MRAMWAHSAGFKPRSDMKRPAFRELIGHRNGLRGASLEPGASGREESGSGT